MWFLVLYLVEFEAVQHIPWDFRNMAGDGFKVKLHVYDLSQGLARQLSATFLGKAIEAVWHTGLVVYGKEYYFSGGIQHDPAGKTPYGNPVRIVDLGVTHVPEEVFEEYLQEISPRYTGATYSLLSHNCNNFSNEVAQFLVDTTIPDYILRLPNEVMSSPMGALILPMIQQLETTLKSGTVPQAPQFASAAAVAVMPAAPSAVTSSPTTTDASVQATGKDVNSGISPAKVPDNGNVVPPAVQPASARGEENSLVAGDPLGEARNMVQEEIAREFTAIMATGTLRASEAAALAARRVMERHGLVNAPMQRG
ncbi:uncharacterized protein LOC103982650 isoform X1 [Musa acuminata AAA Group]|uniref:uncharacterized protein LOC103982650 isoform X1 n=2 Tax=Musa acuminata AAA Group TaxID=214697 RepID=UPI0031D147F5